MRIRDLPLEACVAVPSTAALNQVANLAARTGARYIMVHQPDGEVKGVQLTTVANWMANQAPTTTAATIPVVESVKVELGTPLLDVLTMLANTNATVLLVSEPEENRCRIVQRMLVEFTASAHQAGSRMTSRPS